MKMDVIRGAAVTWQAFHQTSSCTSWCTDRREQLSALCDTFTSTEKIVRFSTDVTFALVGSFEGNKGHPMDNDVNCMRE